MVVHKLHLSLFELKTFESKGFLNSLNEKQVIKKVLWRSIYDFPLWLSFWCIRLYARGTILVRDWLTYVAKRPFRSYDITCLWRNNTMKYCGIIFPVTFLKYTYYLHIRTVKQLRHLHTITGYTRQERSFLIRPKTLSKLL